MLYEFLHTHNVLHPYSLIKFISTISRLFNDVNEMRILNMIVFVLQMMHQIAVLMPATVTDTV